jgi:type II secretory ATPase GspE/PulE/Tfp pilus assembly ATPase PilB-like protein
MGCPACNQSGYRGLIGVQEVLTTSDELQEAILRRAPVSEFRELVELPMRTDALEKLKEGRISLLDFVSAFEGNESR